jgi:hypothetical protein
MHSDKTTNAPGLKRRGKDRERLYWVARADIARAGYKPKSVRLHYDEADPAHRSLIEAACHKFQAEMPTFLVLARCCTTSLPWTLEEGRRGSQAILDTAG